MTVSLCILPVPTLPQDRAAVSSAILSLPFGKKDADRLLAMSNRSALAERLAARRALAALLEQEGISPRPILRTPTGKPYFEGESSPAFSLSHTKTLAVAALSVSSTPIGVDLETCTSTRNIDALASRYFTKDEYESWKASSTPHEDFFRLWTQKEAQAKIHGEGLARLLSWEEPPKAFLRSFQIDRGEARSLLTLGATAPIHEIRWHFPAKEIEIHERQN